MYHFNTQIRVRYAETDQMGYVYYGNYAMYYEVARVECLRELGYSYKELEESGVMMPVLENHSTYLKPAKYDDLLDVRLVIPEKPGVKIKFTYDFYNQNNEHIHQGKTLLAFVKRDSMRPCRPPEVMQEALYKHF
jgi:acyl-CoA thioester hydrolase